MPQRGNVHDLFFKQSFSEPGVAADFVRQYLPAAVAATLDVDSIQLLSGSFVEERLKGRQSDLLFYAGKASDAVTREHMEAALLAAEPQEGANIMPTLAQQWMAEGRIEGRTKGLQEGQVQGTRSGLLTGIEVALDLKFGAAGLALLPEIRAIPDVALLEAVLGAVRGASSVDELRAVYRVAS